MHLLCKISQYCGCACYVYGLCPLCSDESKMWMPIVFLYKISLISHIKKNQLKKEKIFKKCICCVKFPSIVSVHVMCMGYALYAQMNQRCGCP